MGGLTTKNEQQIKGGVKMKKLKNEKGFSLVELLIVIAIMGVLAVIAFNMFGGVLAGSKKSADIQQGKQIEKGILTYCMETADWKLASVTTGGIAGKTPEQLIQTLMKPITIGAIGYGPYIIPKDPSLPVTDPVNATLYNLQWNVTAGGLNVSWDIDVYPKAQTVTVTPSTTNGSITISTTD